VLVVTVALASKKFVIGQIEAVGSNLLWVELVKNSDKDLPQSYEMTIDDMQEVKLVSPASSGCGNQGASAAFDSSGCLETFVLA
jgi:hypothetical protein